MNKVNPIYFKDFYKSQHYRQYPEGTTLIFNNFTPRKSRMEGVNHSVFFGLKYFLKNYIDRLNYWCTDYHDDQATAIELMSDYDDLMHKTLGGDNVHWHIKNLAMQPHLPIAIYALPELTVVPCGVPALVMHNTHPDFFWLPNMLETILSCTLWGACTSATIAREYRLLLDRYAHATSGDIAFVDYQAHDFSFRGMFGLEAACISGMAHLQYFKGTDTIPAMICNEQYYDKPLHICSVPATEHSVMSAGGKENELATFARLLDLYPTGILSIVSDTWNLWKVVSDFLPALSARILARNGKLVIRPDSGDPADIICGIHKEFGTSNSLPGKGLIECLWEIFGGTITSKGYKQLNSHIGAIYGDSITLERATDILNRLKRKGFASSNIVFGIGSYTYQYNTRDTLGWAMKATYAEINGQGHAITKNPITDDGTKKSHSGLLKVVRVDGAHGHTLQVLQDQTWEQFHQDDNLLKLVYKDGTIVV